MHDALHTITEHETLRKFFPMFPPLVSLRIVWMKYQRISNLQMRMSFCLWIPQMMRVAFWLLISQMKTAEKMMTWQDET
jgi:hypothetical protein